MNEVFVDYFHIYIDGDVNAQLLVVIYATAVWDNG